MQFILHEPQGIFIKSTKSLSSIKFILFGIVGPLQDSAVWFDETQTVLNQLGRRGNTSPLSGKEDEDPLGLSDEGTKARSEDEMLELFPECEWAF